MSEMVERVRDAIADKCRHAIDPRAPYAKVMFEEAARAMMEAMREPTAGMIDAGVEAEYPAGDLGADQVAAVLDGGWRAMIGAALKP